MVASGGGDKLTIAVGGTLVEKKRMIIYKNDKINSELLFCSERLMYLISRRISLYSFAQQNVFIE